MIERETSVIESIPSRVAELENTGGVPSSPETETYISVGDIANATGKTWQWAVRYMSVYKDRVKKVEATGIVNRLLFPANLIDLLGKVPDGVGESEGWLSTRDLSDGVEVDYSWVVRRLFDLSSPGEIRQSGVRGEPTVHFPPESLDELRRMKEEITTPPTLGEEFTVAELARKLGRHPFWVEKQLLLKGIEPTYRMHKSHRVLAYYSASDLEALRGEDERYKPLGRRVTIPTIAHSVGMDREWVIDRLQEMGVEGELGEHPNFRRVYVSYPRNILTQLQRLVETRENPSDGWMTENALVDMLGRSHNWVRRRIARYQPAGEMRIDERESLRKHYSPEFVQQLLKIRYDDETGAKVTLAGEEILYKDSQITIVRVDPSLLDGIDKSED